MNEALVPVIVAAAAVLITALICGAALSAWRGWLNLKRLELGARPAPDAVDEDEQPSPAVLIEVAAVKERLRRLEAIANGVEL